MEMGEKEGKSLRLRKLEKGGKGIENQEKG